MQRIEEYEKMTIETVLPDLKPTCSINARALFAAKALAMGRDEWQFLRFGWIVCLTLNLIQGVRGDDDSTSAVASIVGDGQIDNTGAIQALVDQHSGSIRLRPGTYRLSKTIVIDLNQTGFTSFQGDGVVRFVMEGGGPALRFIGSHRGTADPKSVESNVWERQRAPMVDGIEIVGSHPEAVGIEADGTMQLTISRVVVRRALHAIRLTNRNRNVIISSCHLYENRGIGIYLDEVDLHQINVNACHISYNEQGGVVSRGGNVRNLHITGCDIESNMGKTSPPTANVLIDCRTSNHGTAEVAITGCTIQHNSESTDSANIRILGQALAKPNQPSANWGNVTITGNVLSDVSTNIHLQACRGVTIQGNTFWMAYEHNLLLEDCSHLVLSANNLDRNPSYAYGRTAEAINAVVFRNCEDCTVTGLHVSGVMRRAAAVLFDGGRRLNISSCTIVDCQGIGMHLRNVSESIITSCLIHNQQKDQAADVAFRLEGGSNNTVVNNRFAHGSQISNESIVLEKLP